MDEPWHLAMDGQIFRLIFESSPFGILIADDEGRYVEANGTACRLFAVDRQDLVGKRVYDFVDPSDLTPIRHRWDDFRQEKRQSGQFPLVRPDGGRRVLRYHAVADVAPGLHVSFLEDVTEVLAAERALAVSEARFRTLADGLPLVIWMADAQGRSLYFNRSWFEYTGLRPLPEGSPDLDRWVEVIHPDDATRAAEVLEQRRARGEELELTFRLRRRDGSYRWHLARSIPIRDESGQVMRWLGSATDIEDQRRAIDDLQVERDLRERFVATLSHDLRSPLSAVKMGAELVVRRADQPDQCQAQGRRIIRNVDRVDQMIQNLLEASRISAGEPLAVQRAPCDVSALVREVVAEQATVLGDRFVLEVQPAVRGLCDEGALTRTLENLLGNAVKYGDAVAPVRVRLQEREGEIQLAVHNLGPPIPDDEQPRIFQPYHRAAGGGGGRPKGWGLGLTLVRGTAEAHGGTVRVTSSADAGTTFTVTLRRD